MSRRGERDRLPGQRCGDIGRQCTTGGNALAYQSTLDGDLQRPPQPTRPPGLCHQRGRGSLLQIVPLGVADLARMAVHRRAKSLGEPDCRPEVVDVGVGEQDRPDIGGSESQRRQRCQHIVTIARKTRVDQHDTGTVADQCPVHQGCLGEMNTLGDGGQHRTHAGSLGSLVNRPTSTGVETTAWLN